MAVKSVKSSSLELHERFKAEVFDFMLKNDDIEAFVDFFSERVLELYGCDQVIYRDIDGRQILKERPGTPPLDFSLCKDCPHYAFEAPVYKDGFTAIDDCSVGYNGVPVHKDCRVKASLTYIVHEDDRVFGYIALHYLDKVHKFTADEKNTFDRVAKFMSLVLSRRKRQESMKEMYVFMNYFTDTFVSSYYIDLDTRTYKVYSRTARLDREYPVSSDFYKDVTAYAERDIHPDDRAEFIKFIDPANIKKLLKKKKIITYGFRDISDGTEKAYGVRIVRGAEERFAALAFADVTGEMEHEADQNRKLHEALRRNEAINRIIKSATWSVRFNKKREIIKSEYSPELRGVIGNDFDDNDTWIRYIHPDERDRVVEESLRAMRDETCRTPFDTEYRVLGRDGTYHWIRSAARVILDPKGGGGEMYGICTDIDETVRRREERQRELERALQEAQDIRNRGEMVVDALHSAQWLFELSADDRIVDYHYSRDIGKIVHNPKAAETYEWGDLVHPDDYPHVIAEFSATLKDHTGKTPYDSTFRMIGSDGKYRWFRSVGNSFRREDGTGEFSGIHMDVTERVERERAAAIKDQMLSGITMSLYGYNITVDVGSGRCEAMRGSGMDCIVDRVDRSHNYNDLVEDFRHHLPLKDFERAAGMLSLESIRKIAAKGERGFVGRVEYEYNCPVHGRHWHRTNLFIGEDVDGKMVANILSRDVTREHEQFEKMQELERLAAQAKIDAAEETSRAKTAFLANMSHDIRTPMNAIIGFTDIARKHLHDPKKIDEYLDKVELAGANLLEIINDILDLSKIDSQDVEITEYPAYISRMPGYFHTICSMKAQDHGHEFICEYGEIRDDCVWIDKPHLNRIVLNLLSNSIKYTPDGGVIRFCVTQLPDRKPGCATYRLVIEDNGIGMSEEYQKQMFERFSRERNSTVSGIQGTGIGMAITKSLTDAMGGTIEVESKENEGTKFTLVFDFRRRLPGEGEVEEDEAAKPKSEALWKKKRVLLVEDNEINREIGVEVLKGAGFEIDVAVNGKKAVDKIAGGNAYDLVLMDIMMPVMGGLDASRAIREWEKDRGIHVPIIALSANAFTEDKEASLAAGMDDHVAKPIKVKALMEAIARHL